MHPPTGWRSSTATGALRAFGADSNALAVLTGSVTDILVVDVDFPSLELWRELEDANGPVNALRADSCRGGFHFYFSLAASVSSGLTACRNQEHVYVHGTKSSIDVRAEGGFIFAPPTEVPHIGPYRWASGALGAVELGPLPTWLLDILNGQGKVPAPKPSGHPRRTSAPKPVHMWEYRAGPDELAAADQLLRESHGDTSSTYCKTVRDEEKVQHQYRTNRASGRTCPHPAIVIISSSTVDSSLYTQKLPQCELPCTGLLQEQ